MVNFWHPSPYTYSRKGCGTENWTYVFVCVCLTYIGGDGLGEKFEGGVRPGEVGSWGETKQFHEYIVPAPINAHANVVPSKGLNVPSS